MKFKIKNYYVLGLASWLQELNLSGKESRVRSRFIKILSDRYQETDKFRQELVEKYGRKGSDGKVETTDDGKSFIVDDKEAFIKEINELYDEEFVINLEDYDKVILSDIVLNTNYVFGPKDDMSQDEKVAKIRQANDYEMWCKSFEEIG